VVHTLAIIKLYYRANPHLKKKHVKFTDS